MRGREIPVLHQFVSELGVSLGPLPVGITGGENGPATGRFRRAMTAGIDVFDLTSASNPPAWESAIGAGLSTTGRRPLVILGQHGGDRIPPSLVGVPSRTPAGIESAGVERWDESRRRLGQKTLDVVLTIDPSPEELLGHGRVAELVSSVADGELRAWGVAWSRSESARTEIPTAVATGARILMLPYNLLDPSALVEHADALARQGVSTIVRDPFAGGRLDGTFLREGPLMSRPGSAIPDLTNLHRRYDPVLPLGFLTQSRRRTLAQAALQVVLSTPSVATVAIPDPAPEQLAEYVELEQLPEISVEEWRRWCEVVRDSPSITNIGDHP